MPGVKPDVFLVTQVVAPGGGDTSPDAARLRMSAHLALAGPLVEAQQGVVLREGGDRLLARFSDPVRAALCAVRVQQVHRNRSLGPAPPAIRAIVFGAEFEGGAEEALAWSRTWLPATGAGEIVLSASVAAAWREQGNRELAPRAIVTGDGPAEGALLLWENHSREPARTVRRRGWLFVGLVALPSLIMFVYSLLHLPSGDHGPTGHTLLFGPFWQETDALLCDAPPITGWRVLADPSLRRFGPPREQGARLLRATGTIERRGEVPTAVLDLVDTLSGRHLGRASAPCGPSEGDAAAPAPCVCFSRLTTELLERPAPTPDPFVQEVCNRLLEPGVPAGHLREAAVARCAQDAAGSGAAP